MKNTDRRTDKVFAVVFDTAVQMTKMRGEGKRTRKNEMGDRRGEMKRKLKVGYKKERKERGGKEDKEKKI